MEKIECVMENFCNIVDFSWDLNVSLVSLHEFLYVKGLQVMCDEYFSSFSLKNKEETKRYLQRYFKIITNPYNLMPYCQFLFAFIPQFYALALIILLQL